MVSLAVIENNRPVGLINRDIFLSQMSKPFHRELYSKKSCIAFMDKEPLIVDAEMSIEDAYIQDRRSGRKSAGRRFHRNAGRPIRRRRQRLAVAGHRGRNAGGKESPAHAEH
jgi:hypothetical protein